MRIQHASRLLQISELAIPSVIARSADRCRCRPAADLAERATGWLSPESEVAEPTFQMRPQSGGVGPVTPAAFDPAALGRRPVRRGH